MFRTMLKARELENEKKATGYCNMAKRGGVSGCEGRMSREEVD